MAKRTKLMTGTFGDLEAKVAAKLAESPTRKEALLALERLQPVIDRVQRARATFLKVMGEAGLTEKQRTQLMLQARGHLGDLGDLIDRV